jgi:3',5'-cyclic-AMP phosphodiesterase
MPIHLSAISRRQFLRRTLTAGAGLALSPHLTAASRRTDPDSWALLADPHIAADRARLGRGINMADHFATAARDLLALPKRPAGAIIAGDLAFSSGETGDYTACVESLQSIRHGGMPLHLALGNHDHRERFWAVLEEHKAATRPVADKHVALLQAPRANWFVLDSLETTLSAPGLLGAEQLDWLARSLDANRTTPALIVIHHNPAIGDKASGLTDSEALFEIIRPRKQVKAYIFGHTHIWRVQQDPSGIHLINLPPTAYVFRDNDPSGWVHAMLERNGMTLELRCVNPAHSLHAEVTRLQWRAG